MTLTSPAPGARMVRSSSDCVQHVCMASTAPNQHACKCLCMCRRHAGAPQPLLCPTCVITPRSGSATRRVDVYLSCNALSAAAAADIRGAAAAEAVAEGPGAELCGCWWCCCCCVRPLVPRASVCCCCEGARRPVASPAPDRPKLLCIFSEAALAPSAAPWRG